MIECELVLVRYNLPKKNTSFVYHAGMVLLGVIFGQQILI